MNPRRLSSISIQSIPNIAQEINSNKISVKLLARFYSIIHSDRTIEYANYLVQKKILWESNKK